MQAPAECRALLVSSSIVNGLTNVVMATHTGLHVIALANAYVLVTSVRWWNNTDDVYALKMDRLAVVIAYSMHAVGICYYHDVSTVIEWARGGCALILLSYYIAYVVEWRRLSFFVWFLFHCVQTYNNIQQYLALLPRNQVKGYL